MHMKYNACPHIAGASVLAQRAARALHPLRVFYYYYYYYYYCPLPIFLRFSTRMMLSHCLRSFLSIVCARFIGPEMRLSAAKSPVFDHPRAPASPPCPGDPIVRSRIMWSRVVWSRIMRSRIMWSRIL